MPSKMSGSLEICCGMLIQIVPFYRGGKKLWGGGRGIEPNPVAGIIDQKMPLCRRVPIYFFSLFVYHKTVLETVHLLLTEI